MNVKLDSLPEVFMFRTNRNEYVASRVYGDEYYICFAHEYDPNDEHSSGAWHTAEMLSYLNDDIWTYLGAYMPEVETLELSAGNLEEVL